MKRLRAIFAWVALGFFLTHAPVWAVQPNEILSDPKLEARARALSANLRCMVCQNQSIDDSDAGLARDLRVLLRERLKAGDSDDQVMAYLVDRYGEFILLKPRFATHTLILWLAPALLVGMACVGIAFAMRGRRPLEPTPLTAEEEARLRALERES